MTFSAEVLIKQELLRTASDNKRLPCCRHYEQRLCPWFRERYHRGEENKPIGGSGELAWHRAQSSIRIHHHRRRVTLNDRRHPGHGTSSVLNVACTSHNRSLCRRTDGWTDDSLHS